MFTDININLTFYEMNEFCCLLIGLYSRKVSLMMIKSAFTFSEGGCILASIVLVMLQSAYNHNILLHFKNSVCVLIMLIIEHYVIDFATDILLFELLTVNTC